MDTFFAEFSFTTSETLKDKSDNILVSYDNPIIYIKAHVFLLLYTNITCSYLFNEKYELTPERKKKSGMFHVFMKTIYTKA